MRAALILAAAFGLIANTPSADSAERWLGKPLSHYLDWLNEQGQRIIYTSDFVADSISLDVEPDRSNVLEDLLQILARHGLTLRPGPADSLLVVQLQSQVPGVPDDIDEEELQPAIPEIVVTSSLHRLERSSPATHAYLAGGLATRMPKIADEAIRLTHRLPGTAGGGVSTQSHVRGGERNEVLFLFDGLRLYEPYHLKDFQTITSILNSSAVAGIDFYSGAFPARYGDRMSGVQNVEMRVAENARESEVAISFFNTSLKSAGRFGAQEQGDWLLTSRRGNLDLIADVINPEFGSPAYQDHLAHLGWDFGAIGSMSVNVLVSNDKLSLNDTSRGEQARATYTNEVGWIKWVADWSDALSSETLIAASDISNRRRGTLDLGGITSGSIEETRDFRAIEIRQDWRWIVSRDWMVKFGLNSKELDAQYQTASTKYVTAPFDEILDNESITARNISISPSGVQYAAYAELRWRPNPKWTADFGLRWDQQSYTASVDDKQYSPRLSVLFEPDASIDIRIGLGRYYQAQEINELQVSDGQSDYFPAQYADHAILNVRRSFESGLNGEVAVYRKAFRRLRPRFENKYNTLTLLPELQFDRVRIDPASAEARGVEITLSRGSEQDALIWWLSYTWSETFDETVRGSLPRSWDQRHALKGGVSVRRGKWTFSAAGEAHSGWPRPRLTGELVSSPDGGTQLELTTLGTGGTQYANYHALDARISRDVALSRGNVTVFFEITNLYNRANPCCTEYSLQSDGSLGSRETHWPPLVPSLGLVWRF